MGLFRDLPFCLYGAAAHGVSDVMPNLPKQVQISPVWVHSFSSENGARELVRITRRRLLELLFR
jgi:hypothetical protein